MTSTLFANRTDMVIEINKLGDLYDIKSEFIQNPYTYMLCCVNMEENKCEARIVGMYSQKSKTYAIKRLETVHSCQKNKKRADILTFELQKTKYLTMRIGEIVENLHFRLKAGYFEVFKSFYKITRSEFGSYPNENLSNTFIGKECFFPKEPGMENIIGNADFIKNTEFDPTLIDSCNENSVKECLLQLRTEFESLNCSIKCRVTKNSFFFKHSQMSLHLRDVAELKICSNGNRTIVLCFLFDPSDDHIVQSCLISDEIEVKAIEQFLDFDVQVSEPGYKPFFLVDLDYELIQILKSKNIPFFIKSRAVSFLLQESKDNDPNALEYFSELNYGEKEFLETDKSSYLKAYCQKKLYNLNNAAFPDFDFLSTSITTLPLIDCTTAMVWLISADLKNRKLMSPEALENKLSEHILDIFDDFEIMVPKTVHDPDLTAGFCGCGKFQENLFPCIHAYKKIKDLDHDPILYVSSLYSVENILKIDDIVPVVDVKIHPLKAKPVFKRKKSDTFNLEDHNGEFAANVYSRSFDNK